MLWDVKIQERPGSVSPPSSRGVASWANQAQHRHWHGCQVNRAKGGFVVTGTDKKRGTWICLFNWREKLQPEKVGVQTAQRWIAVLVTFTGLKLKCVISLKCYCKNVEGRTWDCSEIAKWADWYIGNVCKNKCVRNGLWTWLQKTLNCAGCLALACPTSSKICTLAVIY